jgi:DNA-binding MarR family transcriptional regulator
MHPFSEAPAMPDDRELTLADCNCRAVRQAARYVTQIYDRHLAPCGLRISQFGILAMLKRKGPLTINELAAELIIDRTTLGRNIQPLERDGLIAVKPSAFDRRSKELHLSAMGDKKFREGRKYWLEAQKEFEASFGSARAVELRGLLSLMVAGEHPAAAVAAP